MDAAAEDHHGQGLGAVEWRVRLRARWLVVVCALIALVATVAAAGCAPGAGDVTPEPSTTSSAPTEDVPSSTTGSGSGSGSGSEDGDLVILLADAYSMVSTYHIIWPDYQMPVFALWADGRVLVLQTGGWGAGTPVYLEAQLDRQEIDMLRGWIEEADVSTLADVYPQPIPGVGWSAEDAAQLRLRVREGGARADVVYTLGYTVDDVRLPAHLDTLDRRLRTYRPPNAHTFVHESIEVVVTERARTAVTNTYYPLPAEFSLAGMTEVFRSVEEVRYNKTFTGAEAARIATRIDPGESLYQDDRRSYWISYRPLLEWPEP